MPRFIKILQILIAIAVAAVFVFDLFLHGISMFSDKYAIMAAILWALLELALLVIYKLIEDD